MRKDTHARCRIRSGMGADCLLLPKVFGKLIVADDKIVNIENGQRARRRNALLLLFKTLSRTESKLIRAKSSKGHRSVLLYLEKNSLRM